MRTAAEAVAWGRAEITHPTQNWHDECKSFVRQSYDINPSLAASAHAEWELVPAAQKHTGDDAPEGTAVFWAPNHVALSTGGGKVLSTDIERVGKVDEVNTGLIKERWGLELLGWSTWFDGHDIGLTVRATAVKVSLATAQADARAGTFSGPVADALRAMGLPATREGYAKVQEMYGYSGQQADGIPGPVTFARFCAAHGLQDTP